MCEYIPTDTDISEMGDYQDDYNGLLAKNSALNTENEILKKQLKDEIFERDNRIQHLIFENEKMKNSLESANNLLIFYQSQDNSKYKKINEQLSSKNFDLEQTNHALKRENFNFKSELEEMKNEMMRLNQFRSKESIDFSVYSTYQGSNKLLETENNYDCNNTETNSNGVGSNGNRNQNNLRNPDKKFSEDFKNLQLNKNYSNESPEINQNKKEEVRSKETFIQNSMLESEKFLIDERLTEKDLANNENEIINRGNNNLQIQNNSVNEEVNNNQNEESCDSSTEETKNMNIENLKIYIKKIKKEGKDFYKKALDMLTENEFEIMKLKSENELIKEITGEKDISSVAKARKSINRKRSTISEMINESVDIGALMEEIETLKRDSTEKQYDFENEKNVLNEKISNLEMNQKLMNSEYENEICKLKFEIENLEIEKNILEKDLNKDSKDKNNMAEDLEQFNQIIRNLEEQKDKSDVNNKMIIESLMTEKKKMEKILTENGDHIIKLEKEIRTLKESEKKAINELNDNFKKEKLQIEKELIEAKGSNNVSNKEKELLKKEIEAIKASFKNLKAQNSELTIEVQKLNEFKNTELKKIVAKYESEIEEDSKKFNEEKNILEDKIKELSKIIDENGLELNDVERFNLQNIEMKTGRNSIKINEITKSTIKENNNNNNNIINNFNFETLNKEIENLKSKNFKLQVEINTLNNKLKVKENKIANTIRLKTEIDALKKEKSKYKSDMLELKKLYEEQINELMEKLNKSNKNETGITQNIVENSINNLDKESIEELKETILKLNYEKKFLNEKIEILNKELENIEKLKNEYIKKLKTDLEQTEDIAARAKLSVAQIVFEKDTELVKYKKYCKKLKTKLQVLQFGTPMSNSEIISPEKSRENLYSSSGKKSLDLGYNNGNFSGRVNVSEYGTNVSNDKTKKGFFEKLFK